MPEKKSRNLGFRINGEEEAAHKQGRLTLSFSLLLYCQGDFLFFLPLMLRIHCFVFLLGFPVSELDSSGYSITSAMLLATVAYLRSPELTLHILLMTTTSHTLHVWPARTTPANGRPGYHIHHKAITSNNSMGGGEVYVRKSF